MALAPGTRLGPYEVQSALGAGGMGEVYKATDKRLDRTVAIKVLPEHVASDPELKHRFEREAKTLAALSHPHICPVFDVGSQEGIHFLVMEYLEGDTLEQRLTKGALPLDQALQIAIQIADALAAAHRASVIHRDIKPGNIMLTKSGAKLLDFGLAKLHPTGVVAGMTIAPTVGRPLTGQGTILGTLHYMAPEQVEGKEADHRSDIFGFGTIVYEMTTGKRAFEGRSAASIMAAILEREPPAMSTLQPLTPPLLDHVVRRCLAKNSDERWQSTSDLTQELKWLREGSALSTSAAGSPHRMSRERLLWSTAMALSLVTLLTVLPVVITHVREAPVREDSVRLSIGLPSDVLPTVGPGPGVQLALSPDARQLAFVASVDGGPPRIWVRALNELTGHTLAGTEGASLPFWSPDSQSLGFFADGKLRKVNLSGGPSQTVCDVPDGRGGTWNQDGVIVFAAGAVAQAGSVLYRVPASGGTAEPVTKLDEVRKESFHRWPQFLPDGRHFLFFTGGGPQARGIAVGSLDAPAVVRLVSADARGIYAPPGYLLYMVEGSLLARRFDATRLEVVGEPLPIAEGVAFSAASGYAAMSISERGILSYSSRAAEQVRLTWVGRVGQILEVVPESLVSLDSSLLSADGTRLVATRRSPRTGLAGIWLFDLTRGTASPFMVDTSQHQNPVWSSDGARVVFSSNRDGAYDLYEKAATGVEPERALLKDGVSKFASQSSPDGRFIVYHRTSGQTGRDLWILGGDRKPIAYLQVPFDQVQGQVSPDGRWMAYTSNESGRMEIYVQSFPTGPGKWLVSTGGGSDPRWRRDGRELFYLSEDRHLMTVSMPASSSLQPGVPQPLFETSMAVDTVTYPSQYDVAADGQRFLVKAPAEGSETPITVVINWDAALK